MDLVLVGLSLGLAAGVSPGPLLTLVVSSSLQRGFGAGLRVALAPIFTDAPIILIAVVFLRDLSPSWLALVTTLGGCVVIYLGVGTLRSQPLTEDSLENDGGTALDLWRGAVVNLLNPHPWIFWATVQGPLLLQGWRRHPLIGLGFVAAFYLTIVGSKITIAWLVGHGRQALDQRWYKRLLIGCGLLLIGMGIWFVLKGLTPLL